jgi:hypothetical protein
MSVCYMYTLLYYIIILYIIFLKPLYMYVPGFRLKHDIYIMFLGLTYLLLRYRHTQVHV